MQASELIALGFDIVAGQVDYQGKNYGVLGALGATLTPEGEELVASLKPVEAKVEVKPEPKARKPKQPAAEMPDLEGLFKQE